MPNMIYSRNPATHRPATLDARLPAMPVQGACLCGARVMLRRGRYVEHMDSYGRCGYSNKTPAQARQMAREEGSCVPSL